MIDLISILSIIGLIIALCFILLPRQSNKVIRNLIPKRVKQKAKEIGSIEITNKYIPIAILIGVIIIGIVAITFTLQVEYASWLNSPFKEFVIPIMVYENLIWIIIIPIIWLIYQVVSTKEVNHDRNCLH